MKRFILLLAILFIVLPLANAQSPDFPQIRVLSKAENELIGKFCGERVLQNEFGHVTAPKLISELYKKALNGEITPAEYLTQTAAVQARYDEMDKDRVAFLKKYPDLARDVSALRMTHFQMKKFYVPTLNSVTTAQ